MKAKEQLIKEVEEAKQAWFATDQASYEAYQARGKARQALKEYEEQHESE